MRVVLRLRILRRKRSCPAPVTNLSGSLKSILADAFATLTPARSFSACLSCFSLKQQARIGTLISLQIAQKNP
jgi:hypothetical protein